MRSGSTGAKAVSRTLMKLTPAREKAAHKMLVKWNPDEIIG